MLPDDTRGKIENITQGIVIEGTSDHCTSVRNFICGRYPTSTSVKTDFEGKAVVKKEQATLIEKYCDQNNLWVTDLPGEDRYLTRGGEARVYLHADGRHVIKLNDGVYYATWLEFFNSILLHNYIFQNTAYTLEGMTRQDNALFAVLKQPFITTDTQVELEDIKKFLEFNGFANNKRHDYIHIELGLILEDMHDENVLVNSETLFFIDTVFYTVDPNSLK